jgi:hypothetical protein
MVNRTLFFASLQGKTSAAPKEGVRKKLIADAG